MSNERKYLLMESKYGDKKRPQFWGKRSEASQPRSFNGYTNDPSQAELYTFGEIMRRFAGGSIEFLPIETRYGRLSRYTPADWKNHQNNDDIFVITETEAEQWR